MYEIRPGIMPTGSINVENQRGEADLDIPISGPGGSGSIHVRATKEAGGWTIDVLTVRHEESGQMWDLTPVD